MVALVEQKRLANPPEVGLALLIDLDPRSNPGVDNEVIAEATAIDERLEELDMFLWHRAADDLHDFLGGPGAQPGEGDAIALQALQPAELQPAIDHRRIAAEDPQQHFLVIAEEEHGLHALAAIVAQALDDLRRAGPAIDQVADKHQHGLARGAMLEIGMDLGQQMLEQVDAAVDVPDDIGAIAPRTGGALSTSRGEIKHQDPGLAASKPARTSR